MRHAILWACCLALAALAHAAPAPSPRARGAKPPPALAVPRECVVRWDKTDWLVTFSPDGGYSAVSEWGSRYAGCWRAEGRTLVITETTADRPGPWVTYRFEMDRTVRRGTAGRATITLEY